MHPIARYRRGRGWTQAELAHEVGVNLSTVQAWERGAQPRPRHLRQLAGVLQVDGLVLLTEITDWTPTRRPKEAA